MTDSELLSDLKEISKRWNYSPKAALQLLDVLLRQQSIMVTPNFGPWPTDVEEHSLSSGELEGLPNWVRELIPTDARLEKHRFADGREIAKLVTAHGRVLLAVELEQRANQTQTDK